MASFLDLIENLWDEQSPRMRYRGDGSRDSFTAWQSDFLAKLKELRGDPLPRPEARVELLDRAELEDHVREHIAIDSVLGTKVPAYVLIPKSEPAGPRPGVMALHGHIPGGKEPTAGAVDPPREEPDDYGLAAVRAGFVTLCPDWWGWGERAQEGVDGQPNNPCNRRFVAVQKYGVSLLSIMLSDAIAALDAFAAREDVDAARIAAMGNSFGGRMSMWLTALDRRVRCAVCAGCFNCFRERSLKLSSCGAQFPPGLLQWGDVEDVFSLIAPRPLMIMTGSRDSLIIPEYAQRMRPVVERAYDILGTGQDLTFHEFEGAHYLPQRPAVEWLQTVLGST